MHHIHILLHAPRTVVQCSSPEIRVGVGADLSFVYHCRMRYISSVFMQHL
jgi:hypothetical protein